MFLRSLNIPGSGLTAEQHRLNIIAQNITNVETTRTESGGVYRRKVPIYQEVTHGPAVEKRSESFLSYLSWAASLRRADRFDFNINANTGERLAAGTGRSAYITPGERTGNGMNGGVRIARVSEDPAPGKMVYDPGHPDADEEGYVEMPNVEMVQEMVSMMAASRSYEANLQVFNSMKAMAMRALELGR